MNNVVLIGRLTKNPELKFASGSGNGICRFTLAVARQFKKDETDFINCVAFSKTAETIAQYLIKGSQIAIRGSIRTGSYDAQDGTKIYTTDVLVDNFEFIGPKDGNSSSGGNTHDYSKDSFSAGEFDELSLDDPTSEMPF